MMLAYDNTEECLFCGKPRAWNSVIMVIHAKTRQPIYVVTVCPKDRKTHTIEEIYEKALEKIR